MPKSSQPEPAPEGAAKRVRVRWVRSALGFSVTHKRTIRALGLRRLGQVVEQNDTPQLRGMLSKVARLVSVEEAG